MKIKDVLPIYNALLICGDDKLDSSVKYCIARNIKKLKKHYEEFIEENQERIKCYGKKDEKGEFITVNNKYDFGDKIEEAEEKYQELLNKEIEFEPYTIKQSSNTDALPVAAQVELLDVIIIEEPK
jgi:DUF4097 and DUF4098 domain-containing protein YvlB